MERHTTVIGLFCLLTLMHCLLADIDQCEQRVDDDCKHMKHNLDQYCNTSCNWGEMSGCNVSSTGVNYSVSWCPKFIRNNTCLDKMKIRINHFEVLSDHVYDEGVAHIEAHIPGFNKSIYAKSFDETCETLKKKIDSHIPKLQLLIDCPFSLKSFLEKVKPFHKPFPLTLNMSNPLPTIVPAGSYHLLIDVLTKKDNQEYFCVDGWLEFGV